MTLLVPLFVMVYTPFPTFGAGLVLLALLFTRRNERERRFARRVALVLLPLAAALAVLAFSGSVIEELNLAGGSSFLFPRPAGSPWTRVWTTLNFLMPGAALLVGARLAALRRRRTAAAWMAIVGLLLVAGAFAVCAEGHWVRA